MRRGEEIETKCIWYLFLTHSEGHRFSLWVFLMLVTGNSKLILKSLTESSGSFLRPPQSPSTVLRYWHLAKGKIQTGP